MTHSVLAKELGTAELGDRRLTRRLQGMVTTLEASPSSSLPKAFSEAELEAGYRFFSNEKVSAGAILRPHWQASADRVRACSTDVLAIHDTTVASFSGDILRDGLSPTRGKGSQQGFLAHVTLAVQSGPHRRPLGTLGLTTIVRSGKQKGAGVARESERWWRHVEFCQDLVGQQRKLIHVMDRESDDYALFGRMHRAGERFVIRLAHNRMLQEGNSTLKLFDKVMDAQCVLEREVQVCTRKPSPLPAQKRIHPPRQARVAKLAVGVVAVTIQHPKLQAKKRRGPPVSPPLPETLSLFAVHVWEIDPPEPKTAVCWLLLTNEPTDSPAALAKVVDAYRSRWAIEDFFKALKTGCAYEQRQLESFHALENCLALFIPVAYQLLLLRGNARSAGDEPAVAALNPVQLQVLTQFARKPLPDKPTARDAYLAIAALGGHLKRNGEPGWLTLLRGYAELTILTRAWVAGAASPPAAERCDQ